MNPCFFNISANENFCPDALARLERTAMVLNGWTTHHPRTPPNPDVAKITDFGNGATVDVGAGVGVAVEGGDVARYVSLACRRCDTEKSENIL